MLLYCFNGKSKKLTLLGFIMTSLNATNNYSKALTLPEFEF